MYSVTEGFNIGDREIKLITIKNNSNMEVKLINYGATIVELLVPDRNGTIENVILTYEEIEDYIKNPPYFGATLGRTSGRIANGLFMLEGEEYQLHKNFEINHGHGGSKGFTFQCWDYVVTEEPGKTIVEFIYNSKDMEEGYPGNLNVRVTYTLTDGNQLLIEYEGETDKKTLCNLTNHSYFNLSGNYKRKVTQQYLRIKSNEFLELNKKVIPTGKLIDVNSTPMNFKEEKLIGKDIESNYEQLTITNGYDHAWLLSNEGNQIEMYDGDSGRKMVVSTTYPSVVIYTYNHPNNEKLKYNMLGSKYDGICFETQYEPDGINHEKLNSAILDVGEKYYEKTELRFLIV
ncbi:aldose 1-epimerase [Anaerovirgula multivorans]|uniref:Aldose 1-epimerase n=1 Tax=Anaerovirgula multivorans TaxID=312168 RepID=A0A239C3D5_9FIRM|nr:aldose epimerase family protein [Anaerovirgula multivorans]SNS13873.1 aldose 1-epimerase [Anaerovirgula multivorans]